MQRIAQLFVPLAASLLLTLGAPALAQDASGSGPNVAPLEQVESTDAWDARNGWWIWCVGFVAIVGLIGLGYASTPKPVEKVTKIVGTTASGMLLEEDNA